MTPSHYPNQCWPIISEVLQHSFEGHFHRKCWRYWSLTWVWYYSCYSCKWVKSMNQTMHCPKHYYTIQPPCALMGVIWGLYPTSQLWPLQSWESQYVKHFFVNLIINLIQTISPWITIYIITNIFCAELFLKFCIISQWLKLWSTWSPFY